MQAYLARRFLHRLLASTALSGLGAFATIGSAAAGQLPTGYATAYGNVGFQRSSGTLTIDQRSQGAIVDYNSFSIGRRGTVNIRQPNGAAVLVNRVNGATPSTIAGRLDANGQVYLINPNGIAITRHGVVKVGGGFVASSLAMSNDELKRHRRQFKGSGASAAVSNAGTIVVGRRGYAALIGGEVTNSGTISVPMGKVALGSGEMATLDVSGDGFLQVAVPTASSAKGALVSDSGSILAAGGTVVLDAATARAAARNAVNITGSIDSHSISGRSGAIVIGGGDGGTVDVSGRLDASSDRAKGGAVTITGAKIALRHARVYAQGATGGGAVRIGGDLHGGGTLPHARTVSIDKRSLVAADATRKGNGGSVVVWSQSKTSFAGRITARGGPAGGSGGAVEVSSHGTLGYTGTTDVTAPRGTIGTLLLDPYDVVIANGANNTGGSFSANTDNSVINAATLDAALATADVTITTGSGGTQGGTIKVAAPIAWSSPTLLTLSAANGIAIDAPLRAAKGGLTLDAGGKITATGSIAVARYTQDAGAFVQNKAKLPTFSAGDFEIAGGTFLRATGGTGSAAHPYRLDDVYGLQGIATMPTRHFALAGDIDASQTATWNAGAGFAPIGSATTPFTGTLNGAGHAIADLTIDLPNGDGVGLFGQIGATGAVTNVALAGANVVGNAQVGALAGVSQGRIADASSAGAVGGVDSVGGLVGTSSGTIVQSSSSAAVTDNTVGAQVGGLVGANSGGINESYATGAVTDKFGSDIGGLAGFNSGTIADAYATSAVLGTKSTNLGGLVGTNSGTLTDVFATGYVGKPYLYFGVKGSVGAGLVGDNQGAIVDGYWDVDTSGRTIGVGPDSSSKGTKGLSTLSTKSPFQLSSYAGFSSGKDGAWAILPGQSFPYLKYQFSGGKPQVIDGIVSRAPLLVPSANPFYPYLFGFTVGALGDGKSIGFTTDGYNGYYSLLLPPGTIKASGTNILTYLTGDRVPNPSIPPPANSFYDHATGSITGLNLYGHYLSLYSSAGTVTDMAKDLAVALGSQSGDDFIFSVGPGPTHTINLFPDPLGLESGSEMLIVSSGPSLNLDQLPTLGSAKDNLMLIATRNGATITQSAPITGGGRLSLVGAGAHFVLTDKGNDVTQFAADAKSVKLTDAAALNIGQVNTIQGVKAQNFVLQDAAGVRQTGTIAVKSLALEGAGGVFTLTNAGNSFASLAADTGTLKLSDNSDLTIDDVGGVSGVTATTFALADSQAVSQSQAVSVKNLLLTGAGGTLLLTSPDNDIGTIAGDTGTVDLRSKTGLLIGQVLGVNGLVAQKVIIHDNRKVTQSQALTAAELQLVGATANDVLDDKSNSISLLAARAGTLDLADTSALVLGKIGNVSGVAAATFALQTTAGVKQTEAIKAKQLALDGPGGVFALTDTANNIPLFAASAGTIKIADSSNLQIGAVKGLDGVEATALSIADSKKVSQNQAITAHALLLLGAHGSFNLPNKANTVHVLAANTGTVILTDRVAPTIGQVFGVSGVTASKTVLKSSGQ